MPLTDTETRQLLDGVLSPKEAERLSEANFQQQLNSSLKRQPIPPTKHKSIPQAKHKRPDLDRSLNKRVLERDGYRCLKCGSWRDLTVDHIIPLNKDGKHVIDNCQTLCRSCNSKKGDKLEKEALK